MSERGVEPGEALPARAGASTEQSDSPADLGGPGPSWSGSGRLPHRPAAQARSPGVRAIRDRKRLQIGGAELELASFSRRAAGFVVDRLLLGGAVLVFTALLGLGATASTVEGQLFLVVLLPVGYNWPWNSIGWSPGKRVVGLRIVREEGGPPGPSRGFGRSVGAVVSDLLLGLGYLWALWDRNNQTWHDKLAGTYVVLARPREGS